MYNKHCMQFAFPIIKIEKACCAIIIVSSIADEESDENLVLQKIISSSLA